MYKNWNYPQTGTELVNDLIWLPDSNLKRVSGGGAAEPLPILDVGNYTRGASSNVYRNNILDNQVYSTCLQKSFPLQNRPLISH